MHVPAEEEQNQTVAEQWIEKTVKKQGKANFLGRTAFTVESEKLSLLKDIIERYYEGKVNRHRDGNRDGRVTETETETETKKAEKNKQETGKRKEREKRWKVKEKWRRRGKKPQCK